MSLLESCPTEILEEMLQQQRDILSNQLKWENEDAIKTLMLIEYIKIEMAVRELNKN